MAASEGAVPAFFEAAELASNLLAQDVVARRWTDGSALAGMSVGGLAAHIYLGVRRLEASLEEALPEVPTTVGVAAFYGANRVDHPDDLATGMQRYVRDESEQRAARYGPGGTHQRFVRVVGRLQDRLPETPLVRPVPVLQVPDGVTPLAEYLATRVTELVVHSDDLAASVDLPPLALPGKAASVAVDVLVTLARGRSGDLEVIRALSRRERASEGVLRAL
jgi:hypothetical protein